MIKIKRIYEPAHKDDEYRVLVDRLWPRGLKKSTLIMDEWAKVLAPSTQLRKSFGHDPAHWRSFQEEYKSELKSAEARKKLDDLSRRAQKGPVTLLYAARDETHNEAVVLKNLLEEACDTEPKVDTESIEHEPKKVKKDFDCSR